MPYEFLSKRPLPAQGTFAVHQFTARREGSSMAVSLRLAAPLPPRAKLTAMFGYVHGPGSYRWSRLNREGNSIFLPMLLSHLTSEPQSPAFEFEQALRLDSFAETPRVQVEFYLASRDRDPVLVGRAKTVVEP